MSSANEGAPQSAKKKLVIFDAESSELLHFKRKYQNYGYDVTAVLVAATKLAGLRDENFKPNKQAIAQVLEEIDTKDGSFPSQIGQVDYIVTNPIEAATLVKSINPMGVLTDENMKRANEVISGAALLTTLRSEGFKGAAVLHTSSDIKLTPEADHVAKANDPAGFAVVQKSSRLGPPADAIFSHVQIEQVAGRAQRSGGGSGRSGR